jgi:protein arginine kinase activator
MQCEICKEKKATVHFKQVCDGTAKEMYICEACAAKKGFNVEAPVGLTDFLFGIGSPKMAKKTAEDKACPACHMRRSDFRKTSRLGCPACYETFADDLAPMLEEMHRGGTHTGKAPTDSSRSSRVSDLRKALERAVAAQNFEEAARLRDLIREGNVESSKGKVGSI